MRLIFAPSAARELVDAVAFYNEIAPELGGRLAFETDDHLTFILANPEAPRLRRRGYRRVNLKAFPYYIAYSIERDAIVVLAFAHSARKPGFWVGRPR